MVGAYVSAATTISLESFRSVFARALADHARHLAVLSWVANGKPVANSFPAALDLEAATTSWSRTLARRPASCRGLAALLATPAGARPNATS